MHEGEYSHSDRGFGSCRIIFDLFSSQYSQRSDAVEGAISNREKTSSGEFFVCPAVLAIISNCTIVCAVGEIPARITSIEGLPYFPKVTSKS